MHLQWSNSRFLNVFCELKESLKEFLQLLYEISTFQLFIKENNCTRSANAMEDIFVIMAFQSCNLTLTLQYSHPINTAKVFLHFGDCINWVPLSNYKNNDRTYCNSVWGPFTVNLISIFHVTSHLRTRWTEIGK